MEYGLCPLSSPKNKSILNPGFKEPAGQGDQNYTCKTDQYLYREIHGPGSMFMRARALGMKKDGRASWSRRWAYELGSRKDWGPGRNIAVEVGKGQCTWVGSMGQ